MLISGRLSSEEEEVKKGDEDRSETYCEF